MRRVSFLFIVTILLGCSSSDDSERIAAPFVQSHPYVVLTDSARERIAQAQLYPAGQEVYDGVVEAAAEAFQEPSSNEWDANLYGDAAFIAETNAFLMWYTNDCSRKDRVIEAIDRLDTNWEDHSGWGINIRMPAPLMHFASTWDFMRATDCDFEGADLRLASKLVDITEAFYERYVLDPFYREASIGLTQNNHPIRTAAAIGTIGLVFEDLHPAATDWLNWAVSELDYLWGIDGQYVQPGGAVNEGPHYYGFGFAPTVAFFISLKQGTDPGRLYERNCINRSDLDPWAGHGCMDGESFVFLNPLDQPRFWEIIDWSMSLRLPNGKRAPVGDAPIRSQVAAALLPHFGAPDYFTWDWASNADEPYKVKGYHRLAIQHLAMAHFDGLAEPPSWTHRALPESGVATLRTGWTPDDLVLSIWAESGSARKAVHNHVDSTSIVFAGLGELFITDTGYYKPSTQDNAVTAQPSSHNVILIDGQGAPKKGLLTNWGDADAFIENAVTDSDNGYVEAVQSYQDHNIRRFVSLLRSRYGVVGEFLSTDSTVDHSYRRRFHAYAGDDLGGETSRDGNAFDVIRPAASLRVFSDASKGEFRLEEPQFEEGKAPHVHQLIKGEGHHAVIDGVVVSNAPSFLSILVPHASSAQEPLVTTLESGDGAIVFRIQDDGLDDIVVLNRRDSLELDLGELGELRTDADFVWLGLNDQQTLQRGGSFVLLGETDRSCVSSDAAVAAFCENDRVSR